MDKKICVLLLLISVCLQAGRTVVLVNNLAETISIKGPTKSTNKQAIPVTLNPGDALVQDVETEGGVNDTLVVTLLGHQSGLIRTFSKKYTKPFAILIFSKENDPAKNVQSFDLWQTDTFSNVNVSQVTSF